MANMGDRPGRWAMVIEKDGSISYAENEKALNNVEVCRMSDLSHNRGSKLTTPQLSSIDTILTKV